MVKKPKIKQRNKETKHEFSLFQTLLKAFLNLGDKTEELFFPTVQVITFAYSNGQIPNLEKIKLVYKISVVPVDLEWQTSENLMHKVSEK